MQKALGNDKVAPNLTSTNKTVNTQTPQRPAIPVVKLKSVLAHVPDDDCLVPSKVYDFFILDKEGHNKGYLSSSGELHWWPAEEK